MRKKKYTWFKRKLTIILIPHDDSQPMRTTISTGFLFGLLTFIICCMSYSILLIGKEFNYKEIVRANRLLREKAEYFAKSVESQMDLLAEVREIDTRLRGLLHLRNPNDMIELAGIGGPSFNDQFTLSAVLSSDDRVNEHVFKMNVDELEREAWERLQSFREINDFLTYKKGELLATPSIWPIFGDVTSAYGWRVHPLTQRKEFHYAVDIENLKGTPVRATADGRVVLAGWQGSYGKCVLIDHGYGFSTRYAHNSTLLVKPGEKVKRGQIIALSGDTGACTAPHLHYEVWYQGKPLNPLLFVRSKPAFQESNPH